MLITGAVLRSMGAARPYAASRPLSIETLHLAPPGPGELLVRIEAAGLCHSDLSVVDGNRPRPMPMLLGHESAGIVEAIGEGVDLRIGQRVVTVFLPRCEQCENCRTGGRLPCSEGSRTNAAGTLPRGGMRIADADGRPVHHHLGVSGFATHAVVDHRSVVAVADDVPAEVAALLGCAVLTGGGAVRNAGMLSADQDLVVVGLGGVGMAAILVGASVTAGGRGRVIGVDSNPRKLESARELGAAVAYTPDEAVGAGVKAPVVVEAAGHPRAFETALALTAPGGVTVTAGLPPAGAMSAVEPLVLTAEARTIVGSYLGSSVPARDIPEYERMWREGRLPVEQLMSATIRLDEINEALDDLHEGRAIRQVIAMASTPA